MTDEAKSRIAFLKDAFARISAAPFDDREALTKEFAQEFQRRDPETAAKLKRWGGDGWFLWRACEIALEFRSRSNRPHGRRETQNALRWVALCCGSQSGRQPRVPWSPS